MNAALIDRAYTGANFLEGLPEVEGEIHLITQSLDLSKDARTIIAWIDEQLKNVRDPSERIAAWVARGQLTAYIDQEKRKLK